MEALVAFDAVTSNPSYATLASAMDSIPKSDTLSLHSDEAWGDIQSALLGAHAAGDDPTVLAAELTRVRDRVRFRGRKNRRRQISRTVLVKGLEYDHVVIADIGQITDLNNLYVALTRARKSIWVVGKSSTITVT
jgi:predicted secreted protein